MRHARPLNEKQVADSLVWQMSRFRKESAKGISLRRMEMGRTPSNMVTADSDVGGADLVLQDNIPGNSCQNYVRACV